MHLLQNTRITTLSVIYYNISGFQSYYSWLGWPLWNICVTNDHGYVPLVVNTSRSFPRSWLITGFVTRLTRRVSLVEQELPTLPEHLSSPLVFSGVRVTRSRRVNLVTYPVISHERGKDREVFTTSGTYPWSFVTQIFHNGQPSRGGSYPLYTGLLPYMHYSLMAKWGCLSVTRLSRRVSLVEQELPTLPEHLSSPLVFSGVRVTRSLVLYVCFVDRCLSFCTFPFGHCVVCSSSIYGFWLPLWYLQTRLIKATFSGFQEWPLYTDLTVYHTVGTLLIFNKKVV
jgi:hypothetical protein